MKQKPTLTGMDYLLEHASFADNEAREKTEARIKPIVDAIISGGDDQAIDAVFFALNGAINWRVSLGKEIEMANERDYQPCARCGKVTHINDLDAKPESGIYDPNGDGDWTQLECAELCQQQIARRGLNYGN